MRSSPRVWGRAVHRRHCGAGVVLCAATFADVLFAAAVLSAGGPILKFIAVKSWEKFQHYKDRDPPWIKLYRDTLTTEAWVLGTDLSRLLQLASTMLAARYSNKIPLQWKLIKKVASLDCTESQFNEAIAHLVSSNFLEIQQVTNAAESVAQDASNVLAKCSSETEQRREETEQRRAEKNSVEQKLDAGPVERIFAHWRSEWGHSRAVLDPKRRRVIESALKAFDEPTLCQSISGYRNSPHHMGENERRTVYDDLGLFLRDANHIENGLRFARGPPAPAVSAVSAARQKLRESINGHVVSEQSGTGDGSVGPAFGVLR